MQIKQFFEPIDAMEVRTQFGEMLDRVLHTHQRFIIQRRGKAKALLVPLSDGELITKAIEGSEEHLDNVYAAFERVKGIITDPTMSDASQTIDEWVYGEDHPKPPMEENVR